jgi:hypothetical protein
MQLISTSTYKYPTWNLMFNYSDNNILYELFNFLLTVVLQFAENAPIH